MKNKARLSEVTAFSFLEPLKYLIIDQLNHGKRFTSTGCFLRFTSQNEPLNNSPIPSITIHVKIFNWRSSPRGGIVLCRLLVPV
jgi:hypothetical protein